MVGIWHLSSTDISRISMSQICNPGAQQLWLTILKLPLFRLNDENYVEKTIWLTDFVLAIAGEKFPVSRSELLKCTHSTCAKVKVLICVHTSFWKFCIEKCLFVKKYFKSKNCDKSEHKYFSARTNVHGDACPKTTDQCTLIQSTKMHRLISLLAFSAFKHHQKDKIIFFYFYFSCMMNVAADSIIARERDRATDAIIG